jgi:hypothetical protein
MINEVRIMDGIASRRWLRTGIAGWIALGCFLVGTTGCQVFKPEKKWAWPWESKEGKPQLPDRILPIWTDTILHQPGKPGIRGFGGRVFFYAGEETEAIEVDGGLIVYAFDTDNMDPHSPEPEKKFVFTPDQFKSHMSDAPMGKSYSVWLPWDEVGGESRSLTLVARFEGRNGGVVLSQPTVKFLPGLSKPTDSEKPKSLAKSGSAAQQDQGVTLATFVDSPQGNASDSSSKENGKRRETQTISLPPSFYRHIQAPPGSPLADPFQDKKEAESTQTPDSQRLSSGLREKENTLRPASLLKAESAPDLQPIQPAGEAINDRGAGPRVETNQRSQPATSSGSVSNSAAEGQPESNAIGTTAIGTAAVESNAIGSSGRVSGAATQRYPFRHIPGVVSDEGGSMETVISGSRPNRTMPMKGGWLEGLKRTPRS